MPYTFNPHRHVKIWLSKDRDVFLNMENQLRLIRMRVINPTDTIHFIYESTLLSEDALNDLNKFCERHNITSHDINNEIIPACENESKEETLLIDIYQDEIRHLDKGGNLAVASDILRWLKPIYTLGTYSDLDTVIDTRELEDTVETGQSILLNIASIINPDSGEETLILSNGIIAVIDPEAANDVIKKIQTAIYKACSRQTLNDSSFFAIAKHLEDVYGHISDLKTFKTLDSLCENITPRELREKIIRITDNNEAFSSHFDKTCNDIAEFLRTHYINKLLLTSPSKNQQSKIIERLKLSDEELLTNYREMTRFKWLMKSVIYTSGPAMIEYALFGTHRASTYTHDEFTRDVAVYSFSAYQLGKVFNLNPPHTLGMSPDAYEKIKYLDVGEVNDLAWMPIGQDAATRREERMNLAARTIQTFFKMPVNSGKDSAFPETQCNTSLQVG